MDISHIPDGPGCYLMRDASGTVIYVGKAKDLKARVSQYFRPHTSDTRAKIPSLVALVRSIDYIASSSEREALLTERQLIYKLQPFFNEIWKDSKSYPYLKITREDFPRLVFTRRKLRDGAEYFGPYPKVEPVRRLLSYLVRIKFINLRRCRWDFGLLRPLSQRKIKACLYYHTGQCPSPCAGGISAGDYGQFVARAADFLNGDFDRLRRDCLEKMKTHSERLEYEKAAMYRNFLSAFDYLDERVRITRLPDDYLEKAVGRTSAVTELQKKLELRHPPAHIECFDTSHLFGRQAVGSSVCFINGEKNTAHYRRYRIRFENTETGGNDFEMIKETVARRLAQIKRGEGDYPDLIVIDGGPVQLAFAQQAVKEAGVRISLISLAKRLEEIYIPGKELPLRLERNDAGLRLLQALRDEAHRFGISYHRKLRERQAEIQNGGKT